MAEITKTTWSKEGGYIWSMIGSAVGFANVLSFSALCYKNGGGAFLIPYIMAHLLVGIPMLFLEGIVGHRLKLPTVSAMGHVGGRFWKTLGWLAVLTVATIGGFYMVLTGFSVAYTYFSAANLISADTTHFFKHIFLQDSGSLLNLGKIAPAVLVSTGIVALISWAVLARNIQTGVERLCSFFLPLLGILVIAFTVATCFLPGASVGFKHYLLPDFARLASWTLWRDVFGQVFFSLSLGLGIVTGYSRHNKDSFSISRAMVKVAIGDFIISFICGFAIFGSIGFMSAKTGVPFANIVTSDSAFEIGFCIFPMILGQFGELAARVIGPLFFFCVFIAGITGVFSIVESIAGNIELEFGKTRKKAVAMAMLAVCLLAIPFCTGGGQHLLGAMAPMVLGNAMLIGGIGEIILFLLLSKTIAEDSIWFTRQGRRSFSFYALVFVVLPLLSLSLAGALVSEFAAFSFSAAECVRWGWLVLVLGTSYLLSRRGSAKAPVAAALK